ncbi:hypothetical protein [Bradyrhizobium valentinum]|nr:hypothetical protein [Bradyrhizobium valentinum]
MATTAGHDPQFDPIQAGRRVAVFDPLGHIWGLIEGQAAAQVAT